MQALLLHSHMVLARRRDDGGSGGLGCFLALMLIGVAIYFVMRGRSDKREMLGAAKRPMGSGSLAPVVFANPFPKCPACGANGDTMKQQWDGLRNVTWSCGYCGNKQVQELTDAELPPSARTRLGLDAPANLSVPPGGYPPAGGGGGGMGGLLTGMMIGSMMGGGHDHHRQDHDWSSGGSDSSGDWGGSGNSDWGDSGGGDSDWGDSGGGDDSGW